MVKTNDGEEDDGCECRKGRCHSGDMNLRSDSDVRRGTYLNTHLGCFKLVRRCLW